MRDARYSPTGSCFLVSLWFARGITYARRLGEYLYRFLRSFGAARRVYTGGVGAFAERRPHRFTRKETP